MKIVTWNVYKDNKTIEQAAQKVKDVDADVVCLQEVPRDKIGLFTEHYPYHASAMETWTERKSGDEISILNLILSKHELHDIAIEDISLGAIYSTTKYTKFSSEFISASFTHHGTEYQICNAHLRCVAPPSVRIKQLNQILELLDESKEQIICGDLNTFSWPLINLMVWKRYKYTLKELMTNGRRLFGKIFNEHGLQNPHIGSWTWKYFPVQYDYILVDKDIQVTGAYKDRKLAGSDHFMLIADLHTKKD